MIKELENLISGKRLKEIGHSFLEKDWGYLLTVF